ncbi:MAG: F0F1 ATP synthase subunit B [Pseudomonadota bacterium]|nr:F0F1 ATP synthase subunit B [Pseudomonadota bacterium]
MDIAVTLVIQGVAFFAVVLVVMRFLWPPLMAAIEERRRQIAEGLAAGTRAQKDLDEAKVKAQEIIREARDKAVQIVDQASKRAAEIVEEAKATAIAEGQRIVAQAHEEIALDTTRAREGLRKQVASLAVQGASHLLEREIDPKTHAAILDKLELEIANG